jgi:hypothetical protein
MSDNSQYPNGYISASIRADNLPMQAGMITELPFGGQGLFQVMIIRKTDAPNSDLLDSGIYFIPDVQFYHDHEAHPLYVGKDGDTPQWSARSIFYLQDTEYNQELLELYDVYFQSGRTHPGEGLPAPTGQGYLGDATITETGGLITSGEITPADLPFTCESFALAAVPKFDAYDPEERPQLTGNAIFLDARLIASKQTSKIFVDLQEHVKVGANYPTYSQRMFRTVANTSHNLEILENYRLFWMGSWKPQ